MSKNYKFHNPAGVYFISFSVIEWLDVFARNEYKDIIIDSFHYCQKEKGMEIFAWCIMTNHVHLIFRVASEFLPQQVIGDLKRFTSKSIVKAIRENPQESRKAFFLEKFSNAAQKSSNVRDNKFWQHENHPIELWSPKVTNQKIVYIHYNPVVAGLVHKPEDYVYSSAKDYSGEKGLVNDIIVVK